MHKITWLSLVQMIDCQSNIWTKNYLLSTGSFGTKFSVGSNHERFAFHKIHFKIPAAKWHPFCSGLNALTHLPQCRIYASMNWTSIGSDNGLSYIRRLAIISTNAGLLSIEPLGTNFSEILIKIQIFSFKKMHLKISSAKWRPFCPAGDELMKHSHRLTA